MTNGNQSPDKRSAPIVETITPLDKAEVEAKADGPAPTPRGKLIQQPDGVAEILARPQVGQQQPLVKENNHIASMKH